MIVCILLSLQKHPSLPVPHLLFRRMTQHLRNHQNHRTNAKNNNWQLKE